MNIYHELNKVIDYIESNLDSVIDYEKIARILGVNVYTVKKLFSLLCNNTIAEYIRKRRLTLSFYDLTVKNEKNRKFIERYNYLISHRDLDEEEIFETKYTNSRHYLIENYPDYVDSLEEKFPFYDMVDSLDRDKFDILVVSRKNSVSLILLPSA